jgi:hypothetical protein
VLWHFQHNPAANLNNKKNDLLRWNQTCIKICNGLPTLGFSHFESIYCEIFVRLFLFLNFGKSFIQKLCWYEIVLSVRECPICCVDGAVLALLLLLLRWCCWEHSASLQPVSCSCRSASSNSSISRFLQHVWDKHERLVVFSKSGSLQPVGLSGNTAMVS